MKLKQRLAAMLALAHTHYGVPMHGTRVLEAAIEHENRCARGTAERWAKAREIAVATIFTTEQIDGLLRDGWSSERAKGIADAAMQMGESLRYVVWLLAESGVYARPLVTELKTLDL